MGFALANLGCMVRNLRDDLLEAVACLLLDVSCLLEFRRNGPPDAVFKLWLYMGIWWLYFNRRFIAFAVCISTNMLLHYGWESHPYIFR